MDLNYSVKIETFAERHLIKSFQKKYKIQWDFTLRAIIAELERIDTLLLTDRAEIICDVDDIKIVKTKFKVAKTKTSAKTSGNRCIVSWRKDSQLVSILLVYGKINLNGTNETAEWKKIIKNNYPQYKHLF